MKNLLISSFSDFALRMGDNRIRYTYSADGTLLRTEYGLRRLEVMPQGGEPGTYVSNGYLFDVTGYNDQCGTVKYTDGRIERMLLLC